MHSAIFALVAIAGLASAGPTAQQTECQGVGQFFVCANNGFRGWCSNDPCDKKWCSDFVEKTCKPVSTTKPTAQQTECQGVGQFFVCANNGFRGWCSNDPCDKKWCSDFVEKTCEPVSTTEPPKGKVPTPEPAKEGHWVETANPAVLPEGQCAPETGFFQVCSNGFKGCCKFDACSSKKPICPTKNSKRTDDTVCAPGTGFFQSCSNGFRGCCKFDACSGKAPVCPTKNAKRDADPTVCPPGTGFFQSCSNGFRGCCKSDACSQTQPICPPTVSKRQADPTVCPPGSGFFQSCSNGFRGCCKGDACAGSWCPDAQTLQVKVRSATAASADGTCRPGTGFFQVCSNGFKGCCKKDACAGKRPVCPK